MGGGVMGGDCLARGAATADIIRRRPLEGLGVCRVVRWRREVMAYGGHGGGAERGAGVAGLSARIRTAGGGRCADGAVCVDSGWGLESAEACAKSGPSLIDPKDAVWAPGWPW